MKKLLMLVLVLGLATVSNAAITLDLAASNLNVAAGEVLTISVSSDTSGAAGNYWCYLEQNLPSIATVSDLAATAAAGNIASITDYGTPSFMDMELAANDSAGGVVAGLHFTGTVTISSSALLGDSVDIWVTGANDPTYSPQDTITLTVIPEPATIALLCLGGLLLRKK